ncbi:hypothetical protein D0B54_04680 [Solimonas sp. K1W22B-7]|nr:hypothetical protein D0B54_04680 [Solimonas sp. K1W22B-7]
MLAATLLAAAALCSACAAPPVQPQPAAPARSPATDLSLSEFYRMPVGPRGLEPTGKLLSLDGQRVRIRGYMVGEESPAPGVFMLTSLPVQLAEAADGPADDLPAAVVFVRLPEAQSDHIVGSRRGPIAVEGRLDLGGREEPNGRVSYVRLQMNDLLVESP